MRNWLRRWNRRDVECHEMRKGKVPAGDFPWLCVGKKLGAQVVVEVGGPGGWQVGCPLHYLVTGAMWALDGDEDESDELLALAEAFEREAKRLRAHLKPPNVRHERERTRDEA